MMRNTTTDGDRHASLGGPLHIIEDDDIEEGDGDGFDWNPETPFTIGIAAIAILLFMAVCGAFGGR